MVKDLIKKKQMIPIFVMIGVFIASYFFEVSVLILILISGIIGVTTTMLSKDAKKGGEKL